MCSLAVSACLADTLPSRTDRRLRSPPTNCTVRRPIILSYEILAIIHLPCDRRLVGRNSSRNTFASFAAVVSVKLRFPFTKWEITPRDTPERLAS